MKLNKYTLPAIIWVILIFIGSSIPSSSLPSFTLNVKDLVLHFIEYSILGALLAFAIIQIPERISWKLNSLVLIIGIIYGASDEIHQFFVPSRFCTWSDFFADVVGVMFGIFVFRILPKVKQLNLIEKMSK